MIRYLNKNKYQEASFFVDFWAMDGENNLYSVTASDLFTIYDYCFDPTLNLHVREFLKMIGTNIIFSSGPHFFPLKPTQEIDTGSSQRRDVSYSIIMF